MVLMSDSSSAPPSVLTSPRNGTHSMMSIYNTSNSNNHNNNLVVPASHGHTSTSPSTPISFSPTSSYSSAFDAKFNSSSSANNFVETPTNASGSNNQWGLSGKLKSISRDVFCRAYGLNGFTTEDHDTLAEEVMSLTQCSRKSFDELIYGHSYDGELADLRALVPNYRPREKKRNSRKKKGQEDEVIWNPTNIHGNFLPQSHLFSSAQGLSTYSPSNATSTNNIATNKSIIHPRRRSMDGFLGSTSSTGSHLNPNAFSFQPSQSHHPHPTSPSSLRFRPNYTAAAAAAVAAANSVVQYAASSSSLSSQSGASLYASQNRSTPLYSSGTATASPAANSSSSTSQLAPITLASIKGPPTPSSRAVASSAHPHPAGIIQPPSSPSSNALMHPPDSPSSYSTQRIFPPFSISIPTSPLPSIPSPLHSAPVSRLRSHPSSYSTTPHELGYRHNGSSTTVPSTIGSPQLKPSAFTANLKEKTGEQSQSNFSAASSPILTAKVDTILDRNEAAHSHRNGTSPEANSYQVSEIPSLLNLDDSRESDATELQKEKEMNELVNSFSLDSSDEPVSESTGTTVDSSSSTSTEKISVNEDSLNARNPPSTGIPHGTNTDHDVNEAVRSKMNVPHNSIPPASLSSLLHSSNSSSIPAPVLSDAPSCSYLILHFLTFYAVILVGIRISLSSWLQMYARLVPFSISAFYGVFISFFIFTSMTFFYLLHFQLQLAARLNSLCYHISGYVETWQFLALENDDQLSMVLRNIEKFIDGIVESLRCESKVTFLIGLAATLTSQRYHFTARSGMAESCLATSIQILNSFHQAHLLLAGDTSFRVPIKGLRNSLHHIRHITEILFPVSSPFTTLFHILYLPLLCLPSLAFILLPPIDYTTSAGFFITLIIPVIALTFHCFLLLACTDMMTPFVGFVNVSLHPLLNLKSQIIALTPTSIAS